jgi:anti-anti-sigma factor
MELEVATLAAGIRQIRLLGRLDMTNTLLIDTQFTTHAATGADRVLVDMAAVNFIASIGMRLLLSNAKAVANRGGRLALCQPQPLVKESLQIAGLDALIPIYDTLDEAIVGLAT